MHTLFDRLDRAIARRRDEQIAFVQRLVQARSDNPFTPETSDPAAPVEREVAALIAAQLSDLGFEPELNGLTPERPNVVARLRGADGGPALILNGHMDTVPAGSGWTRDPWGGAIEAGRLYGRGALDMKASLAMMIYAAAALHDSAIPLAGDLVLTFVVDEEPGGCSPFGTAYLLEQGLTGSAAIVTEPENTTITIGHRGGFRFKLTTHGEAAHTGLDAWERGERGRNAILDMTRAIAALQDLPIPMDDSPAFPGRRPVFTFPTLIAGGTSINTVPDTCTAYGDVRLLPGADAAAVERLVRDRLDALPGLRYTLEPLLAVPPVAIAPDHPLVEALAAHTAEITGQTPARLGCGPWNDGWMFITRGIPAVCGFGPNGGGMHAPDEFVELDSLLDSTRILARAVVDYLGVAEAREMRKD